MQIRMARIKDKDRNNALNEIRILASETAENVIQYKEAFYDEPSATLCIVMEYAQGGDLLKLIQSHAKKNVKVKEREIWKAMAHIAKGLKSLHEKKILHRDLKGANIFITADGQYKIGDLNVSKVIKHDFAKTQTGTPYYASPEVWKDMPYGTKSDMWSLGCVLYEMAAQKPPFTAPDIQSLYRKICNGAFLRIPPEYSNDLATVISSLLRINVGDRPSAAALLNNPLLQEHCGGESDGADSWTKDELLETIKLSSKNYKEINELLPKPKYEERRERAYSFDKRGSYNANNEEKDCLSDLQKKRIKSSFEEGKEAEKPTKRERTISSYTPSSIVSELVRDKLDYPLSQKVSKKLPESTNIIQTPKVESYHKIGQISRLPPCPSNKTSRRKVDTLLNNPSLLDSGQGNKENLRRIGENILGRVNTAKSISEY